ncbi:hypothetical protein FB45DRAFT_1018335 [Roridomyces roridus]|uniref:F-box domain-containing protein n=1 Tax=Roridomyces roridus TaxID=1738132 RepID=A0AAD7CKN4_9AGAR|nr:hypothetical protein FB45DRAFT_1018335 [Roridomyces roridus]
MPVTVNSDARVAMSPAPELPPEVVDAIIDRCASDTATLWNCILVAKEWVPRSRTHIFRHMHVQGHSSFHRFLKRLPAFGPGVHSLTLDLTPHTSPYYKMGTQADLSSFTSLTLLSLHGIEFPNSHAFAQLMASSPTLENVILVDVRWSESSERLGTIESFPRLRELHISCIHPEPIFDWFRHHDLPELHHVGLTLCPASSDPQILGFLAKLPLDHLEIGPHDTEGFRTLVASISAQHGLTVHSKMYYDLTVYEFLRRPLPSPLSAGTLITSMIRLTPTSLFCDLEFPSRVPVEFYDWTGLDYIFNSWRFRKVRRFVLLCSSPLQERTVRSNLPISNRRGVLAFSDMRFR